MSQPQSGACLPPQGIMQFFPGTKGDKGDKGDPGAASVVPGPEGPAGAVVTYVGTYAANGTYYDSANRRDIVDYNGGYWVTNNRAKNGLNSWSAPNVDDWAFIGTTLINVATALRLLYPANINVALNIQSPGYLKSDNFVQYVSGWLLTGAGRAELYDALINGLVSTNTPKFNLDSATRTMPSVGYNELDIPATPDGDILINPLILNVPSNDDDMLFWGWTQGPNNYEENRFGNATQKFLINLEGTGQNNAGGTDLFYIQIYYRKRNNGGAWDPWTVVGQDWYMQADYGMDQSFQLTKTLSVALTGTEDIQFSAGFSKGASGVAQVNGAKLSVFAYN